MNLTDRLANVGEPTDDDLVAIEADYDGADYDEDDQQATESANWDRLYREWEARQKGGTLDSAIHDRR